MASLSLFFPLGFLLLVHLSNLWQANPSQYIGIKRHPAFELFFIVIPLLFYTVCNLGLRSRGRFNIHQYPWPGNIRYSLQRVSGFLAFVFIAWHFYSARLSPFWEETVDQTRMVHEFQEVWKIWFYVVGTLSVCFYLAGNLWDELIQWGMTIGPYSQRISLRFCLGIFFCLAFVNLFIIVQFVSQVKPLPAWLEALFYFLRT